MTSNWGGFSMINLIVVVGAGNNIGPSKGLPVFADRAVQVSLSQRAKTITEGGIVVVGSRTARLMESDGIRLDRMTGETHHAVWSRSGGVPPDVFLDRLEATGKNVFICGGQRTFKTFAPFVENFFIWRAHLSSEPDYTLDPILPGWQEGGKSSEGWMQ